MAFCKFNSHSLFNNSTEIDNIFINDFLPFAPDNAVKVYLYGLYLSGAGDVPDNSLARFAKVLKLSENDVLDCFHYWESQGVVKVIEIDPVQIVYLPLKDIVTNVKKFKDDKYEDFNFKVQEIFENVRMINPREYSEYYYLIEELHIEPEALLMIIKYCVNLKGSKTYLNYILAVAKAWANEGILTAQKVEEKLKEYDTISDQMKQLLSAMSIRRLATVDERQVFLKWTKEWKFDPELINKIAKKHKKLAKSISFEKLNSILERFKDNNLTTEKEVEDFENSQEKMYQLAKKVVKTLGSFYEDLDMIVQDYIYQWKNMGYQDETIEKIALYCFATSIRSIQLMDRNIKNLYKNGIVTKEAFDDYLYEISRENEFIYNVLSILTLNREITPSDRKFYRTWARDWQFSNDMICYAAEIASTKSYPIQYMNNVLAKWHENNITTLEDAQKFALNIPTDKETKKQRKKFKNERTYTNEEIAGLFTSLEEVEI